MSGGDTKQMVCDSRHNEVAPTLLVLCTLHFVFVKLGNSFRILKELGEVFAKVLIDLIIEPRSGFYKLGSRRPEVAGQENVLR